LIVNFELNRSTPPDTVADPFTGSTSGGMAAYLQHYRLINQPKFVEAVDRNGVSRLPVFENVAKILSQFVITRQGE
jgi:predicted PhzF superfamily epimerase YddE/YHI9